MVDKMPDVMNSVSEVLRLGRDPDVLGNRDRGLVVDAEDNLALDGVSEIEADVTDELDLLARIRGSSVLGLRGGQRNNLEVLRGVGYDTAEEVEGITKAVEASLVRLMPRRIGVCDKA